MENLIVSNPPPCSPAASPCNSANILPGMPSTLMFYRFTRRMIERSELGPFMHLYDPARLEPRKYLPALFGRMCFSFEGYDDNWFGVLDVTDFMSGSLSSFATSGRRVCTVLPDSEPHNLLDQVVRDRSIQGKL